MVWTVSVNHIYRGISHLQDSLILAPDPENNTFTAQIESCHSWLTYQFFKELGYYVCMKLYTAAW